MSSPDLRALGDPVVASAWPADGREPFDAVLSLGGRAGWGVVVAVLAALLLHGAVAARAWLVDPWLLNWAGRTGLALDAHLQQTFDIDTAKNDVPPAPVPDEPPEKSAPPHRDDVNPYEDVPPPPAAAQAGKILTDDSDVADFTGEGFVTGTGDSYAGGRTMAAGTGTVAVRAPVVTTGPAGAGTARTPPRPSPSDRSRPLALAGAGEWSCGFPPEADAEQIDDAYAVIEIVAGPDGRPQRVTVKSDPGHGFGEHARRCAMRQAFAPGLDRDGHPTVATKSFRIHFER